MLLKYRVNYDSYPKHRNERGHDKSTQKHFSFPCGSSAPHTEPSAFHSLRVLKACGTAASDSGGRDTALLHGCQAVLKLLVPGPDFEWQVEGQARDPSRVPLQHLTLGNEVCGTHPTPSSQ